MSGRTMIELKNVRPGVIVIGEEALRLAPGQSIRREAISAALERAVARGLLVRVDKIEPETRPKPAEPPPASVTAESADSVAPPAQDLSRLALPDAVARVQGERDPARLREWQPVERRKAVLDAIRRRLTEVDGGVG